MSGDMSVPCALCGQLTSVETQAPEMDEQGLPLAAAVSAGFGVPVIDPMSLRIGVMLDGMRIERCVGFDRRRGIAWRYCAGPGDRPLLRDGEPVVETIHGTITVGVRQ
jgi:hypothetical protein